MLSNWNAGKKMCRKENCNSFAYVFRYHAIRCTILEKYANSEPFIPIPPMQKKLDHLSLKIKTDVCKYYVNSGRCHYGSNCNHYHPLPGNELKIAKELWKRERKKSRDALSDPCDPHIHGKSSHAKRADVFCDFLIETFNNFEKVVDVAGGRGEVSVNLFIRKQISTVLIDPRDDCMRPSKIQMKLLKKLGLEYSGSHFKSEFPTDVVADASLIFGMHPDQATEPIFDYAIKHSISFAVVPCCVFARESPNRKLNGNPVISYEDYITYLMKKDSRIKKCFLKFDGRNQCLFMKL